MEKETPLRDKLRTSGSESNEEERIVSSETSGLIVNSIKRI